MPPADKAANISGNKEMTPTFSMVATAFVRPNDAIPKDRRGDAQGSRHLEFALPVNGDTPSFDINVFDDPLANERN